MPDRCFRQVFFAATIAVLPFLGRDATLIHHDLALHKMSGCEDNYGPQVLYEALSAVAKTFVEEEYRNIFAVDVSEQYTFFEKALCDSLIYDWSLTISLDQGFVKSMEYIISRFWGSDLLNSFRTALARSA